MGRRDQFPRLPKKRQAKKEPLVVKKPDVVKILMDCRNWILYNKGLLRKEDLEEENGK